MSIKEIVKAQKESLNTLLDKNQLALGEIIFNNGNCQILSQSPAKYELIVNDEQSNDSVEYAICIEENGNVYPKMGKEMPGWDKNSYACLLQLESELQLLDPKERPEHKQYTREGMINRVLKERREKADSAKYRIKWASNIYGDHTLTNENGVRYKIFLRDFENETGYSDSADSRLNKLGTTKHLMFAFNQLKENKSLYGKLGKTCPFIEIYCDPLNEYKISWFYPHKLPVEEQLLISRYFKKATFIEDAEITGFLGFIEAANGSGIIKIRPEVREKIEAAFEKVMLDKLKEIHIPDFSMIKADLFPYQKEGIEFALYRKSAIIADEMGLGKTVQAIGTAILKKQIFNFRKTLVVCPASLKSQWKEEIEKFSDEKPLIVQGNPEERMFQYSDNEHYFFIVNYETILRDQVAINKAGFDFLIMDEAQRAKNYETKTANSLKRIDAKHKLVITGTPIENRLIDIFSIMSILDPEFLGPLWEFSYQHCLFDPDRHDKINGYYDLQKLHKKLDEVLIRREKRKVIDQLPDLQQINIHVNLSPLQSDYHSSYAKGISQIIHKKFLTPYDLQRLQLLLASMRMVCDSTYLIDEETNESPKLEELQYILLEKLDVPNNDRKIIIFSEWVKVHKLIGKLLRDHNIGFVELSGKIPVKSRGELIRKFETNPQYKVFLSTEAGGSGLNLQMADTLINFELPWNPAKKNQRIGRIDRIGQKSNKLTIFNFITRRSIEEQIASGLLVKQSLFDGVLGKESHSDFVDFSSKGRSQFIKQLEQFITETEKPVEVDEEIVPAIEAMIVPSTGHGTNTDEPGETLTTQFEKSDAQEIDLSDDFSEDIFTESPAATSPATETKPVNKIEEMEQVMNSGMQFLSGLFKMSTGKDVGFENQKIEVNKETGEVVMRFKLPV
jgi:SNF2 family DNA or RNA helicase